VHIYISHFIKLLTSCTFYILRISISLIKPLSVFLFFIYFFSFLSLFFLSFAGATIRHRNSSHQTTTTLSKNPVQPVQKSIFFTGPSQFRELKTPTTTGFDLESSMEFLGFWILQIGLNQRGFLCCRERITSGFWFLDTERFWFWCEGEWLWKEEEVVGVVYDDRNSG
jgi:hypothetical protein